MEAVITSALSAAVSAALAVASAGDAKAALGALLRSGRGPSGRARSSWCPSSPNIGAGRTGDGRVLQIRPGSI
ncbi:hypothetical protein D4764_04G0000510 [Takifugu flavidus]|uniref:Secreted protein n=1 Tax=Takifugu flavidus TaxID=433684 RepID=A0A5C6N2P5_9TELE|nr:hypothetical protein D4764_04G0000510 [Takifugu flavidus]